MAGRPAALAHPAELALRGGPCRAGRNKVVARVGAGGAHFLVQNKLGVLSWAEPLGTSWTRKKVQPALLYMPHGLEGKF